MLPRADRDSRLTRGASWIACALVVWVLFVVLPSIPAVRAVATGPLFVHDPGARGDAAYVMNGGYSLPERLLAASDLYHLGRVEAVYILDDRAPSSFSFVEQRNLVRSEWSASYLEWLGVPERAIRRVSGDVDAALGSLNEARLVSAQLPEEIDALVVVTSAAHTRRSLLAFERALGGSVVVTCYAATEPRQSAQLREPLWVEYAKLLVYWALA
jgi:uncharacterized SAM-binding protein YcdF (DUF218 family)